MREAYKVFYYRGAELMAYTIRGTFSGEEEATKELLAYDVGADPAEIAVKIEIRSRKRPAGT